MLCGIVLVYVCVVVVFDMDSVNMLLLIYNVV